MLIYDSDVRTYLSMDNFPNKMTHCKTYLLILISIYSQQYIYIFLITLSTIKLYQLFINIKTVKKSHDVWLSDYRANLSQCYLI